VLDEDVRVLVWNQRAEDLWGVRQEEVQGQHFLNLDIGLPVGELVPVLRSSLNGDDEKRAARVEAVNRRGRRVDVLVTSSPLLGAEKEIRGVILITQESDERP
jgi:two-component system CheB/CheR fusion protein